MGTEFSNQVVDRLNITCAQIIFKLTQFSLMMINIVD